MGLFTVMIIYTSGAVLAFVVFLLVLRLVLRRMHVLTAQTSKVVLLVTIAKEGAEEEEDKQKDLKEKIAIAETFYANLSAIRSRDPIGDFFYGRHDEIALEIVAHEGLIKFYIVVPRTSQQFVEQQLLAQYHDADAEEVEDYNIFATQGATYGAAIGMTKKDFFPLRTYQKLDSDPLDALTSVMSKVDDDDGIAVQYVVRPASFRHGRRGGLVAREMQQGKKLNTAVFEATANIVILALWRIFHTIGSAVTAGKKKDREGQQKQEQREYRLTPGEEELVKSLEGKAGKANFVANIRVVASSNDPERAKMLLDNTVNAFTQYNSTESQVRLIKKKGASKQVVRQFIYRTHNREPHLLLSTEELASMYHLPLPTTETPNIYWMPAKRSAPPVQMPQEGLTIGYSMYRGKKVDVRIAPTDRRRHMYIIGKSGVGKSVLQANCIIQDIQNGHGVGVIDPHGDLIEDVLPHIPKNRVEDVVLFNPSDVSRPMGLNMLEYHTDEQKDFAVQDMVAIFYKLFGEEMIGPMFEHYMRNAMLALMEDKENPGTIVEIPRMFTDKTFRKERVAKVKNIVVKNFWEQEYEQSQRGQQAADMLSYVISKIGRFLTNDMMRNIVGQQKSGFNFRDVMDNQKILLVNLSKGKVGEVNSSLLGLILVSKLQMAALGRADIPQSQRKDFFLYIDEFQNFVTDSIATILSEARKYMLDLIIAHQYIGQLVHENDTTIRDAVFGNAGTIISFKVGVDDAETMAKEFAPVFNEHDVINIEKYTSYVKLLIDNTASRAFNMKTYPPKEGGDPEIADIVRQYSRLKFGRDRAIVEAEIIERSRLDQLGVRPSMPPEATL